MRVILGGCVSRRREAAEMMRSVYFYDYKLLQISVAYSCGWRAYLTVFAGVESLDQQ